MAYKLTTKVIDLVEKLRDEGYCGTIELTNCGCSGTQSVMDENGCRTWIQLSGFSKETLNLVEDLETGEIVAVGRYGHEGTVKDVEDIVRMSWGMFTCYESSGYSMPSVFESLYEKYGFIKKEEVVIKQTKVKRLK